MDINNQPDMLHAPCSSPYSSRVAAFPRLAWYALLNPGSLKSCLTQLQAPPNAPQTEAALSTICTDPERIRNRSAKDRSTSLFQRCWQTVQDRCTFGSRSTHPWIPILVGLNPPKMVCKGLNKTQLEKRNQRLMPSEVIRMRMGNICGTKPFQSCPGKCQQGGDVNKVTLCFEFPALTTRQGR